MEVSAQVERNYPFTIAVDFDNTLSIGHYIYPDVGEPNIALFNYLKSAQQLGCKIILWTCRENKALQTAIDYCKNYNLIFDSINENIPECSFKSKKVVADMYIDDRSINPKTCNLKEVFQNLIK